MKNKSLCFFIIFLIALITWIYLGFSWLEFAEIVMQQKQFHNLQFRTLIDVNTYDLTCINNKLKQTLLFDFKTFSVKGFLYYLQLIEHPFLSLDLNVKPQAIKVSINFDTQIANEWYKTCFKNL